MEERVGGSGKSRFAGWVGLCGVVSALLVMGCFYDSRWGESKRLQEAAARHATPKELQPTVGQNPGGALRVMRLRVLATPRYAAEVVDYRHQLGGLVDEANRLLGPTVHVRVEVAAVTAWPVKGDEQDLEELLGELKALDAGEGVDWVVGLAGSLPRAEMSFHELGRAERPGKHLVLRAMNDAREFEGRATRERASTSTRTTGQNRSTPSTRTTWRCRTCAVG